MGWNPPGEAMTVIITGSPAGGTTCVSRVVDALGVTIKYSQDRPDRTHEDFLLGLNITQGQPIIDTVEEYNKKHPRWGFKFPGIFGHLGEYIDQFRDPVIIYVLRDPLAVYQSLQRHAKCKIDSNSLKLIAEELQRVIHLLPEMNIPYLFVSYEKMMTRTRLTIEEIAEFLEVPFKEEALNEVILADPRYLKRT